MSASIQFFENCMSPNKEVRTNAEKDLEKMKSMPVSNTINIFKEGMQSANESIAQLSSLLLQKTYLDPAQEQVKPTLEDYKLIADAIKPQINFKGRPWKTLQRFADCLGRIYKNTSLAQGIGEILGWFNNQEDPISRKFAIYLIQILSEINAFSGDVIDANAVENFQMIFNKGLNDTDVDVKIESLKAITEFLNSLPKEETILKFNVLGDLMLQTLVYALKTELGTAPKGEVNENSIGKAALEAINTLIDTYPKFWKGKMDNIIHITSEIAKTKEFPNAIRETSLELVLSLCANSSKAIKNSANFKNVFLPLIFELLMEVDYPDDISKWEKQTESSLFPDSLPKNTFKP